MQRRRLYLMTDYSSSSLWWERGGMVQLDSLPLAPETKAALQAWSGQMYRWLDALEGVGPPFDEEAYEAEMQAEGERLLTEVRRQLPREYELGIARFVDGRKHIEWETETTVGPPPAPDVPPPYRPCTSATHKRTRAVLMSGPGQDRVVPIEPGQSRIECPSTTDTGTDIYVIIGVASNVHDLAVFRRLTPEWPGPDLDPSAPLPGAGWSPDEG